MHIINSFVLILGGVACVAFRKWLTTEILKTVEVSTQRREVIKAYAPHNWRDINDHWYINANTSVNQLNEIRQIPPIP